MSQITRELVFDLLLVTGAGIAFITYMLGVLLDPIPGIAAGIALLATGLLTVIPREKLAVAATTGLISVLLAGAVVPRYVAHFTKVADELSLSLLLSGVILLFTLALVHVTTFAHLAGGTSHKT